MKQVISVMLLLLLVPPLLVITRVEQQASHGFHRKILYLNQENGSFMVVRNGVVCRDNDHCLISMKQRSSFKAVKEIHPKVPGVHEDYYGPKDHKSKHH